MKLPVDKLVPMLWGDWFYDDVKGEFTTEQFDENNKARERNFCKFILAPIVKLTNTVFEGTLK